MHPKTPRGAKSLQTSERTDMASSGGLIKIEGECTGGGLMTIPTWQDALTRIQVEFVEMPDLKLTPRQVRRLCDLPPDLCQAALVALVRTGFLWQSCDGAFLRRDLGLPAQQTGAISPWCKSPFLTS